MSLRRRTIRGVLWSAVQSGGSEGISTLVFLVLARLLAPEAFGLVALAGLVIAFLQVFVKQGLSVALIQRSDLSDEHIDAAFWATMAAAVALGALSVLLAKPLAWMLGEPELAQVIRALAGLLPLMALSVVPEALLTRQMRFQSLAIRSVLAVFIGGVTGLILAMKGAGVWSLVAMQLVNGAIGAIVLWTACDWRPRARCSLRRLRELASVGVHVMGVNLVGFAQQRADQLIIGSMLGATALGYYFIAQRLVKILVRVLAQPLASVGVPALSAVAGDATRLRNAVLAFAKAPSIVTIPAFIGLAAVAPELVAVLLGEAWAPASTALRLLAISAALQTLICFGVPLQYAVGRPGQVLMVTCIELVYSIAVFPFAAQGGIEMVSIAHLGRSALLLPVWFLLSSRAARVRVADLLGALAPAVTASLIMASIVMAVKGMFTSLFGGALELGALVLVGAVVYLLIGLLLFPDVVAKYGPMLRGKA